MPRKKPAKDQGHIEISSVKDVKSEDLDLLLQEIADLKGKLSVAEKERTEAQKDALAAAEATAGMMEAMGVEVDAHETIEVARCKGYKSVGFKDNGREILKPEWEKVKVPLYFYKIMLPPVGGDGLKINGILLAHGAVVKLDRDTLRTVKEMVWRAWDHERNIHGSDENAYRPRQTNRSILRSTGGA